MKRIGLLFILILAICGISFTAIHAQGALEYDWCAGIYFWQSPPDVSFVPYNLYVGYHSDSGPSESFRWQFSQGSTLISYPPTHIVYFGEEGSELAFSADFGFPVSIKGYRAWFHYYENLFMADEFPNINFSYNVEVMGLRSAQSFALQRPGGIDFSIEDFRYIPSDPSATINFTVFAEDPSADNPETRHRFSFVALSVYGDGQNPFHITSFGNDYWINGTAPCEEFPDPVSTRIPGTPLPQLPSPTPTITPTITPTLELSHTPSPTTTATTTSTSTPTPTPSWSPTPETHCSTFGALDTLPFLTIIRGTRVGVGLDSHTYDSGGTTRRAASWALVFPQNVTIVSVNIDYFSSVKHSVGVFTTNSTDPLVSATQRAVWGNVTATGARTVSETGSWVARSARVELGIASDQNSATALGATMRFDEVEICWRGAFLPSPTPTPSTTATPTATATMGTPPPTNTIDWWLTPSPTRTPYPTNTRPWWWTPPPTQTPLPRFSPIAPTQTPLATTTRVPILPPPSPLPTATVQIWPTWTPSPMISSTPMATTTGTGTPMMVVPWEGGGGDGGLNNITDGIGSLGGGVLGVMSNFMQQSVRYLGEFRTLVTRVSTTWVNSPAVAIPGMPDCVNYPFASQLCAIWYIVRWTIFGAPLGGVISLIMTIIVDLFILFEFIKLVRAILSRAKEILKS